MRKVPDDLIIDTYKNLLRGPRVEDRQTFCSFAICCVVKGCGIFNLFLLYFIYENYYINQPEMIISTVGATISMFSLLGNCYLLHMLLFVKVPEGFIIDTYTNFLRGNRVQDFAICCVVTGCGIFNVFLVYLTYENYYITQPEMIILTVSASLSFLSLLGNCYLLHMLLFVKVPEDLIIDTYKNLLRDPRVEDRQTICSFAICCVVTGYGICTLFLLYLIYENYYITQPEMIISTVSAAIYFLSLLGHCYFLHMLLFVKRFLTMSINTKTEEPPTRETIPLSPGKKFHIFVSYGDVSRDKIWAKKLIRKLETEYGYICCDHERDFLPDANAIDNIKYGVKNSEKVVVVFSKETIYSKHVSQKAKSAYIEGFETLTNILIPVLLDDCDVPEEFMHLTYIDAREGVEETSWWPELIKSIQCTEDTEFAITQLCSIETIYNILRTSIQRTPKNIPAKLQPQEYGVPDDLIIETYENLLRSPRVECRQQFCYFAICCVVIGCTLFVSSLEYFINGIYYITQPKSFISNVIACIFFLSLLGNFYLPYKLIFVQIPNSVHYKIIDYNRILYKYGVLVTVVHWYMWHTAALIFYKCRFELCKEYVIRHLVKEGITHTAEHRDIPNSDRTDGSSPLSGDEKQSRSREEVGSSRQPAHAASGVYMNSCYFDKENKSHDCETRFSEEEDTENKAVELLMWYTPEYLDLAYKNKLKNPKENRHGKKLKCLCQYLEEADEDFREKVKKTKSLRSKKQF